MKKEQIIEKYKEKYSSDIIHPCQLTIHELQMLDFCIEYFTEQKELEVRTAEEILDEREALFQAFDAIRAAFRDRSWLMEGRGAYPDNDERYKEEIRYIMNEFEDINTNLWKQIKSKTFEYRNLIEMPLKRQIKKLKSTQLQQPEIMDEKIKKALENLIFTAGKLWDEIKPIKDTEIRTVTHPIIEEAKIILASLSQQPITDEILGNDK